MPTTLEIISTHHNLISYTLFYISYLYTRSATVLKHLQCVRQNLIDSVLLHFPSPDPWQNAAPCCIQYISHIPVLQQVVMANIQTRWESLSRPQQVPDGPSRLRDALTQMLDRQPIPRFFYIYLPCVCSQIFRFQAKFYVLSEYYLYLILIRVIQLGPRGAIAHVVPVF